jgi:hypothetical protein
MRTIGFEQEQHTRSRISRMSPILGTRLQSPKTIVKPLEINELANRFGRKVQDFILSGHSNPGDVHDPLANQVDPVLKLVRFGKPMVSKKGE